MEKPTFPPAKKGVIPPTREDFSVELFLELAKTYTNISAELDGRTIYICPIDEPSEYRIYYDTVHLYWVLYNEAFCRKYEITDIDILKQQLADINESFKK